MSTDCNSQACKDSPATVGVLSAEPAANPAWSGRIVRRFCAGVDEGAVCPAWPSLKGPGAQTSKQLPAMVDLRLEGWRFLHATAQPDTARCCESSVACILGAAYT